MTQENIKIDKVDTAILMALQADGSLSQRALAEQVGVSQNACWRRLQRLQSEGIFRGQRAQLDLRKLGLDISVIVMIKTSHHSKQWALDFRDHVARLPGVIDFYRIGGEWDYVIKVRVRGIAGYDAFYQKLIDGFELTVVTGHFVMEELIDGQAVEL